MFLERFVQDIRVGTRVLIKEKGFCALAVLVLALGIGGVTTLFSVVDGAFLRGFSFPNADRLAGIQVIDVTQTNANTNGFGSQIFSLDYEAMRAQQQSMEKMAGFINGSTVNITIEGRPVRETGAYVSHDFFSILGVRPALGRDFQPADDRRGSPKVAVISHRLWQREFGGRDEVLGKSIRVNGTMATIVGVMPPNFHFPVNEQIWIPLYSEFPPAERALRVAAGNQIGVLGLIKPGVAFDAAEAEFTGIARQLAEAYPTTNKKFNTAVVQPLIETFTPPAIRLTLFVMLGFCAGILLIACVNVMNMQFARATLRAKELAIRSSLGATRGRLIAQMLTESLLLALIGAVTGIIIAFWATDLLTELTHKGENPIPAYIVFLIDARAVSFVVLVAMFAAVVSGLFPAWMASRTNANEALKESGRGNTSRSINLITRGLVVFQILVTCILLVGALLQSQSIVNRNRIDWGYDNTAILTARIGLMDGDYPDAESRKIFLERLLRELRTNSEFGNVALTNRLRMAFSGFTPIEIEGRVYHSESDRPNANFEQVSDGYFEALGVRLLEGRDFNADDTDAKLPVAIVTSGFARKHFGNESPVGRRFRSVNQAGNSFGPWRTIIGVSGHIRMTGPFNNAQVDETGYFVPLFTTVIGPLQTTPFRHQFSTIIVRPRGDTGRVATLGNALQRQVNKVDPHLPLYFVGTAKQNQEAFLGQNRIISSMFTIFGGVAVVLASVGLYGVMSFSVNQRTQEFGIRMALGADNQRILGMVLSQGVTQLLIGLTLGLGITATVGFLGRQQLENANFIFRVSPTDPLTYIGVALLLSIVALIATFMPALRATRVDPMVALRAE